MLCVDIAVAVRESQPDEFSLKCGVLVRPCLHQRKTDQLETEVDIHVHKDV